MRRGFAWASVLAGVTALTLLPATTQALDGYYGIGSYLSTRYSDSEKTTAVSKMSAVGARWTRLEICYTTGTDFIGDTNAFAALNGTNIKVIALVNMCSGNVSMDDWGAFVQNVAQRFGSKIGGWEILNEPNGQGMSASTYKDYLHRASQKIKAVDPNAIVLVGGLADANPQYLHELYQVSGAKDSFDGVAIHPYKDKPPEEIEFGKEDFLGRLRQIVAVIKANGGNKRIWLTEFGRQSGANGADEQQANYQARSMIIARDVPEVDVISLYNLRDDGTGQYGILRSDFSTKSSFDRMKEVIANGLGNVDYSGQVLIADQQRVDDFSSFNSWNTESHNAGQCEVRQDSGRDGSGMKLTYSFTSDSAYCMAKKSIPLHGAPTTVGLWIDGEQSSNIWRLRIKDATGQTHQLLLGTFPSGWRYVRYDLVNAEARTHFGGANDGVIHYPISFEGILIDRLGSHGYYEGRAYLDDLFVLHGAGDYWGYRFGTKVAAWRTSFSGLATVCGIQTTLSDTPRYFTVNPSDCPEMYSFR